MDVSLLVINAGMIIKGQMINNKAKDIQAQMDVNMYQPTAMLKKFLPNLTTRKDVKSGLIIVSSMASQIAGPAVASYSASKAYVTYLAEGVDQELAMTGRGANLDLQILSPFFVQTQMVNDVTIPLQFLTVSSTQSVVTSSLRQLGHSRLPGELPSTTGTIKHDILRCFATWSYQNTPMFITNK